MITKETCVKIYHCYDQIENCNKLIADMAKIVKNDQEKKPVTLYDAFGEKRGLTLGVPCGGNGHALHNVNIDLGVKIIEQHIKENEQRLQELMAIAKIELAG